MKKIQSKRQISPHRLPGLLSCLDVTECLPFLREHEATARIWGEPSEVPFVMRDHELAAGILNEALWVGKGVLK